VFYHDGVCLSCVSCNKRFTCLLTYLLYTVTELQAGQVDPRVESGQKIYKYWRLSGRVHAVLEKITNCSLLFTLYTILNIFHVV